MKNTAEFAKRQGRKAPKSVLQHYCYPVYGFLAANIVTIARSDTYAELDTVMYDGNNVRLIRAQIRDIQAQLNNGNPNPPGNGRIENNF